MVQIRAVCALQSKRCPTSHRACMPQQLHVKRMATTNISVEVAEFWATTIKFVIEIGDSGFQV